jgi:hypothetical protein
MEELREGGNSGKRLHLGYFENIYFVGKFLILISSPANFKTIQDHSKMWIFARDHFFNLEFKPCCTHFELRLGVLQTTFRKWLPRGLVHGLDLT